MLSVDPKRRINAKEAILHPFFNKRTLSMKSWNETSKQSN